MAFSLDTRDVSITVPEEDRHDSDSATHQHSLSVYNPAIAPATAPGTEDASRDNSISLRRRDEEKEAEDCIPSSPPPSPPRVRASDGERYTTYTYTPPALLSSLQQQQAQQHPTIPARPSSISPSKSKASSLQSPSPAKQPFPSSAVQPASGTFFPVSNPARAAQQEQRIAELDKNAQRLRVWLYCLVAALLLLLALAVIAFASGIVYLNSRDSSPTLGAGSVNTTQLADGAVTSSKLAAGAVELPSFSLAVQELISELNLTYNQALGRIPTAGAGLVQNYSARTLSVSFSTATLALTANNSLTIATAAITTPLIAEAAVGAEQLAAGAVVAGKVAAGAVGWTALAPDVSAFISDINATADAAWQSRAVSGQAIAVEDGQVSVLYDAQLLTLTADNELSIAPFAISSDYIAPASIPVSALSPAFLSLIPTAGPGLAMDSNNSLTVRYDPAAFTLQSGALALANGSVTSAQLAPASVTVSSLSPAVVSTLSAINSTASAALSAAGSISVEQSFLQQQLVAALNQTEAQLAASTANASALLQSVLAVNATAAAALSSLNASQSQLQLALQNSTSYLTGKIADAAAAAVAAIPTAGAGLELQHGSFSLDVDTALFAFSNSTSALTLQPASITAALLQNNAVGSAQLAASAVNSTQLQAGAVTLTKLTPPIQSVLSMLAAGQAVNGSVLVVGAANTTSDVTITTPADSGDLIVQAASGGAVWLQQLSSGGAVVGVSDNGILVQASAVSIAASTGDVSLSAADGSVNMTAAEFALTASGSALQMTDSSVALTSANAVNVSASVLYLSAPSTVINSTQVRLTGSLQLEPATVVASSASLTVSFTSLPSSLVFITGNVATTALSFTGCSNATAGISVSLYNHLRSGTVLLPAGSCDSQLTAYTLLNQQRVTVTCAGLINAQPSLSCARSEQPQGGLSIPSSSAVITNNVVNGSFTTLTARGTVQLVFTVATNVLSLSFVIVSPLLTAQGAVGAVLLTTQSSGIIAEQYSDAKQSALWVCVKQQLNGSQLTVTIVNVGDVLEINTQQTLQLLYQIY